MGACRGHGSHPTKGWPWKHGAVPCAVPRAAVRATPPRSVSGEVGSRRYERWKRRWAAEALVSFQFGVASFLALGSLSKVPCRLQKPTSTAHLAALDSARRSAFRFVRRSYKLCSGRRGSVLEEEHWNRANVLLRESTLPSLGSYETGIRAGRMNKACAVHLRADRVALPASSGRFEVAACLPADMRRTFEDPELLRARSADDEPAPAEAKDSKIPDGNNRSGCAEQLGRAIAEQKAKRMRAGGEYKKREFRTKWAAEWMALLWHGRLRPFGVRRRS